LRQFPDTHEHHERLSFSLSLLHQRVLSDVKVLDIGRSERIRSRRLVCWLILLGGGLLLQRRGKADLKLEINR
jgi:hypothetical protein